MSAGVVEGSLAGRTREVQVIDAALRRVEQGEIAAIFVTGESGVGKTHFLAAVVDRVRARRAVVLAGACLDIGQAPFYALRLALRRFRDEPGWAGTPAAEAAGELITLLDGGVTGPDVAGDWLERISTGLSALTQGKPLVLVLDDLHWVDPTTRDLLKHLLAVPTGMRALVLGAVRAENLLGGHPVRLLLSEWRRRPSVQVLELTPLSRAETERLAEARAGRALQPAEAAEMWTRSNGNPFVVEGLARGLREGEKGLPESLREIALATLDALPAPARTVVRAIAAGVEPVEHDLLQQVVELDGNALIAALRTAVDQRIISDDTDGYRFRLGLFREALAEKFLIQERVQLHRRYAQAITQAPGGPERHARLAHHWRQAGEPQPALTAAVAAAEEAERRYGFAEGFAHWSSAVEIVRTARPSQLTGVDPVIVLRRAAEAAHCSGEHQQALALLGQLAARLADPLPGWLHVSRATYLAALGRPAKAEAEYQQALAGDCADRDRAAAAAHSADLLVRLGRYAAAGQRAREALDLARKVDDTSSLVLASAALGSSQAALDDPRAGRETVQEALRTAERCGRPDDIAGAYLHLAELLTGPLNELETGIQVARNGAERAEALGLGRTYGTRLLAAAANGLFRAGRWAEGEKVITEAFARRPSGSEAAELLLARCRLYLGYGDLDAAKRDLDAVDTLVSGAGGARYVLPLLTLRAGLAMWREDHAAAREAVREGLRLYENGCDDLAMLATLVWHGLRAEAEAETRADRRVPADKDAVRALRQAVERITKTRGSAAGPVPDAVTGYLALCAGELSRVEGGTDRGALARAVEVWSRAAEVWEQRQHPYPAAYARLRQADAGFAWRARNAGARAALQAAYQAACLLRARPLMEQVDALARHARVTLRDPGAEVAVPDQPAPSGAEPAGELARLTERELQVLALVAEALTNQQIARRLRISRATVGVHVTHILEKLQIHSRVQATAIFLRNRPD